MSAKGASKVPNDWRVRGDLALEEQADWYREMFRATGKRDFVQGFCLWDWTWKQRSPRDAVKDRGYDFYEKPAEAVIREFYGKH